jgi:hypothetical protein
LSHYALIAGGRDPDPSVRDDVRAILQILRGLHGSDLRVLHGACPTGVDAWTQEICESAGITVKGFPADWDSLGKRAGPERNIRMVGLVASWLALGHTAQVIAFPGGSGTAHCADTAEKCGLDVSRIVASE